MRMKSIEVNSLCKAKRIVEALKKQGRSAFYEEFAGFNGFFYVIFYKPLRRCK